jgi:hypothetical protein
MNSSVCVDSPSRSSSVRRLAGFGSNADLILRRSVVREGECLTRTNGLCKPMQSTNLKAEFVGELVRRLDHPAGHESFGLALHRLAQFEVARSDPVAGDEQTLAG